MKPAKILTWDDLAIALGVHRATIFRWRLKPDAPADKSLPAWRHFVDQMPSRAAEPEDVAALKKQRLIQEIRSLRLHSDRRENTLVDEAKLAAADVLAEAGKSLRRVFLKFPRECAAIAPGKSGADLAVIFRDMIERALIEARLP